MQRLAGARRPILIGGHGVRWYGNERKLEEAGRSLNIPVFNVPYHQKLLGEESEAYMGLADLHQYPPYRFAAENCDVAVMVGGRLDNQMNFGNPPCFPKAAKAATAPSFRAASASRRRSDCPIVVVIDNNGGLDCISQQQERLFEGGGHFATDFRDIPFHGMFEGMGGYGELVETREQLGPALERALASGKPACLNVKAKGVISPIVLATTDKRDKASIE